MRRTKRRALLAGMLGLATVTATVPLVATGTANAQKNARLCGNYWRSTITGEVLTRIFEVRIGDDLICGQAKSDDLGPDGFNQWNDVKNEELKLKDRHGIWDVRGSFSFMVCERFADQHPPEKGGLANRNLTYITGRFPLATPDHKDICNNMNRSDAAWDVQIYWLYDDNDPSTADVAFQRSLSDE